MSVAAKLDHELKTPVHLDAVIKEVDVSNSDDDFITIRGFANTVTKDRAGDVIVASAWTTSNALKNYLKNPIILFAHDHTRPIGKCVDITVSEMGLQIEAQVFKGSDPSIYNLVKNGVLKTFSVGFRILDAEWDDATDTFMILDLELFEVSVVSVPCNQDSTFSLAKSMNGLDFLELKKSFKQTNISAPAKELSEIEKLCVALGYLKENN